MSESTEDKSLREAKLRNRLTAVVLQDALNYVEDTLADAIARNPEHSAEQVVAGMLIPVGILRSRLRAGIAALAGETDATALGVTANAEDQVAFLAEQFKDAAALRELDKP